MQITLSDPNVARDVVTLDGRRTIRLHDLIHVDVSPTAGATVHNLDHRVTPIEFAHVPASGLQTLAAARLNVRADGRAHDLSLHEQIHARLVRVAAATDEEADEFSFQFKRRRGQRTRALVS